MFIALRKSLATLVDRPLEIALAGASGMLMGIAFAPIEAWYLAWIAIAPLWYLLSRRDARPIVYGLVWGIGCYGLALSWLFGIHPMTWLGVPYLASLAIATFCSTFVTLWGAGLPIIWAWGLRSIGAKFRLHPLTRVLVGTVLWCILEEAYGLTDLWWSPIAMSQSPHNIDILHLGRLAGPTTVSGAIVLVNGLIAEAAVAVTTDSPKERLCQRQHAQTDRKSTALRYLILAAIALVGTHAIGFNLATAPLAPGNESSLKIGVIQGNVRNEVRHYQNGYELSNQNYLQGYLALADAEVAAVVTPETALPYREDQIKQTPVYRAIQDRKVLTFLGGFGNVPGGIVNSLLIMDGSDRPLARYDKWKLVPLGEYIPFNEILGKFIDTISPLDAHLKAGKFAPIVDTPLGKISFGICYDSAYPEHFRVQAQTGGFGIIASNDAHYGAGMPAQHHALDLMRAIETDRWIVEASNTGYSAIIDPHGHARWKSQLDVFVYHAGDIYRRHTQTIYVRFGNWLTPLLGAIALILVIRSPQIGKIESSR